jgi:hypothetical protein
VHALVLHASHCVQLPQHELDQLALAVLGHNGQPVDDHKRIESLVEAHLELFFDVGKVDCGFVKFIVLHGEVFV